MALVQEMAVKIDQGFLGALLNLFTPAIESQDSKEKVTTAPSCRCSHSIT